MSKQSSGRQLRCVVGVFASLIVGGICPAPSPAQYLNYLPWSAGSSLLYPLRMLGGYSVNGSSGFNNPVWYGGGILQRMSRGSGGLGYGGYDPNGNPNFYQINYDDPANQANQTQFNPAYAQPGTMQLGNMQSGNMQSGNMQSGNMPTQSGNMPQGNALMPYNQGSQSPYFQGNQVQPRVVRYGGPIYSPGPKKVKKSKSQNTAQNQQPNYSQSGYQSGANAQAPAQIAYGGAGSQQTAPFAVSFINTVNEKYDGDIRRAFANPETKAWANSLGLINNSAQIGNQTISEERVGVIGRILHDSTLDPVSKLEAIKILLRG